MSKRSLSGWLVLPLLVAAGCGGGNKSTTDSGSQEGPDLAIGGNAHDMSASEQDMTAPIGTGGDMAGGDMAAPMQGPPAFIVDKSYFASGYYSESNGTNITDDASCPTRAGGKRGTCHHISYTPAASTGGYAGIQWQYPANNWGGANAPAGFALPSGYTQVQFWAWGKDGGEVLHFSALDSLANGDKRTTNNVTLTTTPTLYTLGVGNNYGAAVISAFAWDLGSATHVNQFYIDDLVYVAPEATTTPPPFNIDSAFYSSGYIGDGATPGLLTDSGDCSPTVPGAAGCHHFVWNRNLDGGGQGYAGVIWQYPTGNFGGPTDPTGVAVAAGYTEVAFYAWSTAGGEEAAFFAGIGSDTFASKINVILTTTPTLYTLGVGGYGAHVVGGFGWAVGGTPGVSLDLDGIQWR
jgi:hypothetical protein